MSLNFDKEELEQLYRKKYGGLLKFTEEDELAITALEFKKYTNNHGRSITSMETPQRARPIIECATNLSALTDSSSSSSTASSSKLSKTSSGLAKVLEENKSFKLKFAETRIQDVEAEIFAMHAEFEAAANYHAPFLLFMKSFVILLLKYMFKF